MLNEFGNNEIDQETKTHALYLQLQLEYEKIPFEYVEAWRILKDHPKWQIVSRIEQGKGAHQEKKEGRRKSLHTEPSDA